MNYILSGYELCLRMKFKPKKTVYNKNRMNLPGQNRGQLAQYRSQVSPITTSKSSVLVQQPRQHFKQSLVNDLGKKYSQLQQKSSAYYVARKQEDLNAGKYQAKGYEHLLSPKNRTGAKSPLSTYRSRDNCSPQSVRDNFYVSDRASQLEENRSAKFISKLREEINSPTQKYSSPRGIKQQDFTSIRIKQTSSPTIATHRRAQTVIQSQVKQQPYCLTERQKYIKHIDNEPFSPEPFERQKIELNCHYQQSADDSPQKETFERKLMEKCKSLQVQLDKKEKEVHILTHKLQTLQSKHFSQINLIKNEFLLEKSKKESELQIVKKQLEQLEKSIKNLQKSKNTKQKTLSQEISRYAKSLKQSEQQKNRLVLEFEQILRQKVLVTEKKYADQSRTDFQKLVQENKVLKKRIQQITLYLQSIKQQKQDIFEQSKLLHLQLQNYTKWNDDQQQQNRSLQKKLYQLSSTNKLLLQEKDRYETTITELEENLETYKSSIKAIQSTESLLSQELEILKFEVQSRKNELQGKEKEFLKERGNYVQEIQILESKCISSNKQKVEMCEELDYQKKELANMRRLVDSLQQRLEEQRRQYQEIQSLKDNYQKQLKSKSQSLNQLMQQMIYKNSELQQHKTKIQQLQEEIKLARVQKSFSRHILKNSTIQQQHEDTSRTTECMERMETLEKELNQMVGKVKEEKDKMMEDYQQKENELKKRLFELEKELFRKQEAALDDKRKYSLQLAKCEKKINSLSDELSIKKNQLKHLQQQLNIKEIQVKHLTLKTQQLQSAYETKFKSKQQELTDVKRYLNQQRQNQIQTLLKLMEKTFYQLEKSIDEMEDKKRTELKEKNIGFSRTDSHHVQQAINNFQQTSVNKQHSPKKRQVSPNMQQPSPTKQLNSPKKQTDLKTSPVPFYSCLSHLKNFNEHEVSLEFSARTKQLTSFIKLLTKKVNLYQHTIHSLEQSLESQPARIHQKYMRTISQLDKKIYILENVTEIKQIQMCKELRQEKDTISKELQRTKIKLSEKEKQLTERLEEIQVHKKIQEELKESIQQIQKENRKVIKKLNSDIEEYKNLYEISNEQKELIQQNCNSNTTKPSNNSHQNFSSMLTISELPHNIMILPFGQQKTPIKHNIQPSAYLQTETPLPFIQSLQQLLQSRLVELTQENKHLSHQLASVNSELMKEKETFVEMNAVVRELEKEIEQLVRENDRVMTELESRHNRQQQLEKELEFLQSQNTQLHDQLNIASESLQKISHELQTFKQQLSHEQRLNKQLQKQLQTINIQEAQKYVDIKKFKDQTLIKQNQLDLVKLEKDKDIKGLKSSLEECNKKLSEEIQKREMVQKVYKKLLEWFEQQSFVLNNRNPLSSKNPQFIQNSATFSTNSVNQYQNETISQLTSTFSGQLSSFQHTISQLQTINESLKIEIHRHKSLTSQKHNQVLKKQRQLQIARDKIVSLERNIQRMEIEIEEWKFICESSSLNKSLNLENRLMRESTAGKGQFFQSPSNIPSKTIQNSQFPQKGTTSPSQSKPSHSPLKIPPKLSNFQHSNFTVKKTSNNQGNSKPQNIFLKSIQGDLKNSVDSVLSAGQFYQMQKGKHFGNEQGDMSFY